MHLRRGPNPGVIWPHGGVWSFLGRGRSWWCMYLRLEIPPDWKLRQIDCSYLIYRATANVDLDFE